MKTNNQFKIETVLLLIGLILWASLYFTTAKTINNGSIDAVVSSMVK